jgi:hypothetical protein
MAAAPTGTRIFSPLAVARLCVTISHQVNEFNGFLSLRSHSIFRFPHIATNGSFKAHSKQRPIREVRLLFLRQWKVYVLPRFRHRTSTAEDSRVGHLADGLCGY